MLLRFYSSKMLYNIFYYIQGRFLEYLCIHFSYLVPLYLREQILVRKSSLKSSCKLFGSCLICGCLLPSMCYSYKRCPGYCYPVMLSRRFWFLLNDNSFSYSYLEVYKGGIKKEFILEGGVFKVFDYRDDYILDRVIINNDRFNKNRFNKKSCFIINKKRFVIFFIRLKERLFLYLSTIFRFLNRSNNFID